MRVTFPEPLLATLAVIGAAHHDLGHLPFTHLTEELFQELRWTTRPWSDRFRHDERVFDTSWNELRVEVEGTLDEACKGLRLQKHVFKSWLQRAIEGRSGIPFLDGLLNSPLDVDKIDYVFRDCWTLKRSIHLPNSDEDRRDWFAKFINNEQHILPSGLIAISGTAGEHARDFLDERRWLYKHLYFLPVYRAVERVARSVLTLWLTDNVARRLASRHRRVIRGDNCQCLTDVRAMKGQEAQELLWRKMKDLEISEGEPKMILDMAREVADSQSSSLPRSDGAKSWIKDCCRLLEAALGRQDDAPNDDEVVDMLKENATWSERMYVRIRDGKRVAEIIRRLEVASPFNAVFDVAEMPRTLAHANRQCFVWNGAPVVGEMFAVPHADPDRWGRFTGQWIPLSQSLYARNDKERWIQILVVSPRKGDYTSIRYVEDRFRHLCQQERIEVLDEDPDHGSPYS
jgi:HD superfamily phosphohydrolase